MQLNQYRLAENTTSKIAQRVISLLFIIFRSGKEFCMSFFSGFRGAMRSPNIIERQSCDSEIDSQQCSRPLMGHFWATACWFR